MNMELQDDFYSKNGIQKPLCVGLLDDLDTSASSTSSTSGRSSFHKGFTTVFVDACYTQDPVNQIVNYETSITRDFNLYTGLIWLSLFTSFGLISLYIMKHEGLWMAVMCLLEVFCLYTWVIGIEAKKKLKLEIQYAFSGCLFTVVIMKTTISIVGLYAIFFEGKADNLGPMEPMVGGHLRWVCVAVAISLLQLFTSVYTYYEGRKMMNILLKRKNIMGDYIEVAAQDLVVL